jgi:hypothetical protein
VQVQAIGFDRQVQTVQVNAGQTATVNFNFGESKVVKQIERFTDGIGGLGHLMLMMQGGSLGHEDTADNLRLFGNEVLPALKARSRAKVFQAA